MLAAGLLSAPANAGAPAPMVRVAAWKQVPANGRLRVEAVYNCMATPPNLDGKLSVERDGAPVAGKWVREPEPGERRVRWAFAPAQPLALGRYTVRGLPGGGAEVEVVAPLSTPPRYAPPAEATCIPPPRPGGEGCGWRGGLVLAASVAPPPDGLRWIVRVRERGQPYRGAFREDDRVQLGDAGKIAGLRVLDPADREGGAWCEVEVPRSCKDAKLAIVCSERRSALDGVELSP